MPKKIGQPEEETLFYINDWHLTKSNKSQFTWVLKFNKAQFTWVLKLNKAQPVCNK